MAGDLVICPSCGERFELDSESSLVVTCTSCQKVFNAAAFVSPGSWQRMQQRTEAPQPKAEPAEDETAMVKLEVFGRYELVSELGRNDLGVVYRARETSSGQIVALKVLIADSESSRQALPEILRRVKAAAALSHENIAQIYEMGDVEGTPYVASEFVEGRPLDKFLAKQNLSVSESVCLAATAARALAYAHAEGHMHGDIRPQNIIIDSFGNPRLTDFGLIRSIVYAKSLGVSDLASAERKKYALPIYIPPEQANGLDATARSDVYSLGAVLYEMLTGHPPVQADHLLRLLIRINKDTPRPLSLANPKAPRSLESIVMKCLVKEPGDRYGDARALSVDLEAFMSGRQVSGRMPGGASKTWRWFGRRKGAIAAMIVAAVTLGLVVQGTAGWFGRTLKEYRQASRQKARVDARERYVNGLDAFKGKRYRAALSELQRALSGPLNEAERVKAGYCVGLAHQELGELASAEKAFTTFIDHHGDVARGWYSRGVVRYRLKKYPEASADFSKAVELAPGDAKHRYCLGMARWCLKDYRGAEEELSRASELSPGQEEWARHLETVRTIMKGRGER